MTFYDLKTETLMGEEFNFAQLKGKTVLIVNVASKCGFTPQYAGLQALYDKYKENLVVIGFPCDQFAHQEPGDKDVIQKCQQNYGVSFPIMQKIDVNGDNADPVYLFLKKEKKGILGSEAIKWNFTKFLVNKEGEVVKRFAPTDKPEDFDKDIAAIL